MLIILDRGVDDIVFGMSEKEIVNLLGKPSKVYLDDNEDKYLAYYPQKIELKLESRGKLGWIVVRNREAMWSDINPWALSKDTLLKRMTSILGEPYELDDYGSMESYTFWENWVELQYETGELTSFNFGIRFDENDEPIWPKK